MNTTSETRRPGWPGVLLAAILLAGCGTTDRDRLPPAAPNSQAALSGAAPQATAAAEAEPAESQPIDMAPGGSKPVAFERVILSMETGAPIGKVTGGWLHITFTTLKATPGEGAKGLAHIGMEELRKAHYTVVGDENTLFSEHQIEKNRYQLGANITWIQLDLHFQPGWTSATVSARGAMTTVWQVYDTLAGKVAFSRTTETRYEESSRADSADVAMFGMFRKAFRQLLAEPSWVSFMRPDPGSAVLPPSAAMDPISIGQGGGPNPVTLPADFPKVLDAFLTLQPGRVLGSAFIISPDGYALTAAHVVSGLKTVPARLRSDVVLDAQVVRIDEDTDVALLKLPGSSFRSFALSAQPSADIGSDVFAVGNPEVKELEASVTKGVVSGNREIEGRKFIQTDAAANPGSSGGPLLDRNGRAIGIISWKFAGPALQGLAFAVPIGVALDRLHLKLGPGP